jgi:large subunit ribosomal protein L22
MKEVKAIAKNVRSTARKTRIPADAVRGMNAGLALDVLKYMTKGAALDVRKVVASAMANAVENEKMDASKLIISQIFVDPAFTIKRFRPQSKGRVRSILKRNCHITVFVTDGSAVAPKEAKSKVAKETVKAESTEIKPVAKKETKKAVSKEAKPVKKVTKSTKK